jgi:hypothetical protein
MLGLIYFQSANYGYNPLTQSHMNYTEERNKNPKSATGGGNEDAPLGTLSHQHKEVCTFYGGSGSSMMKNRKVVPNLSALKLADETNLSFSFDPPTYYIIIAFLSYFVPIACR